MPLARLIYRPLDDRRVLLPPGLELACISSSRPERAHADLPGIPVVSSPEEACAVPSVALVVIATPNDTHVSIATTALRAGKHVVVEKPLAPTLEGARELASLAQSRDRVLAVFQNRRWDGDFLALSDLVARHALGDVAHFESHFDRYRPVVRDRWRERAGVGSGLWFDLGPHLVDQALQLFGVPDRLTASMAAQRPGAQADDWAHVVLEYRRLRVILHTSALVAASRPRFIVHGHGGSWIKYGLDGQERQLNATLTPDAARQIQDVEHAVLVDGASGRETDTPGPHGDYRQFYVRLRDALHGAAGN
ncbi:MAG: oxidoreductase, partial [Acidobacteriota bacterium]|nr:oxidoreductase [Acidobacteriota bacterium]